MSQDILINVFPWETRVALVAGGRLRELFVERQRGSSLLGNVYLGRVTKVLTSVNAAFVDCGLERSAFLSAGDARPYSQQDGNKYDISELVEEGRELLVQVIADPIGDKGARICARISLSGRNLVFLPKGQKINISRKLTDVEERQRLSKIVEDGIASKEGAIIRTIAKEADSTTVIEELRDLQARWSKILVSANKVRAPSCVEMELPTVLRNLRDRLVPSIDSIVVDDSEMFSIARNFCDRFIPDFVERFELRLPPETAFDDYEIEEQIENMMSPEVNLPSGGSLFIEETQSMTVIDVNTGRFSNKASRETAVLRTNMEASKEIALQLQLRNIGGIIIVDFINMKTLEDRSKVLLKLKNAVSTDTAHVQLTTFSDFGLLELTRRRSRSSYLHGFSEWCESCEGVGRIKTAHTVAIEVLRSLWVRTQVEPGHNFSVFAAPEVVEVLNGQQMTALKDIERRSAVSCNIVSNANLERDFFELVRH